MAAVAHDKENEDAASKELQSMTFRPMISPCLMSCHVIACHLPTSSAFFL